MQQGWHLFTGALQATSKPNFSALLRLWVLLRVLDLAVPTLTPHTGTSNAVGALQRCEACRHADLGGVVYGKLEIAREGGFF